MTTLIATFLLFFVVVMLLAILVKLSGRALKGSCGGVAGGACACHDAGRPTGSCDDDDDDLVQITAPPDARR